MQVLYEGKTKTVFESGEGKVLLLFKDDVTGADGVIDPGANTVIGQIEGKGNASLRMSSYFFELLKKANIPTHYLEGNLAENTMLVKKAEMFGDGLEFVCRLKATGSFVRRYGKYVQEGQPLDYLVEITLKDDLRGDPLINEESLAQLKLLTSEEINTAKALTKKATKLIEEELASKGLELIDIKLEFGRVDGQIAVIDEISGDNMRVRKNGQTIMQKELCALVCD
ncbi:MAG: phosphoribosylaminoimidazolesuccinocarboxamide synthase [Clostridia bacterium]|nr:phosphoribosylaminoimidazolesuccinocarboxamide synthase [Clostridia bacterium]